MSALGQKRTSHAAVRESALPPKADIDAAAQNVRLVPKADMEASSTSRLVGNRLCTVQRMLARLKELLT